MRAGADRRTLRAASPFGAATLLAAAFAAFVGAAAFERPLLAQCSLSTPPNKFDPPVPAPFISPVTFPAGRADSLDVFQSTGGRRVVIRYSYGYVVYSAAAPTAPTYLGHQNFSTSGSSYQPPGDGQSSVMQLLAAPDGSRMLVGFKGLHGTLLLRPSGNVFDFGGDFFPGWSTTSGGLALDALPGGRWMAYSITSVGLYAADATNFLTGGGATNPGQIPSERYLEAPVSTLVNNASLRRVGGKALLVYSTGFQVVVVDVTNPGPAGAMTNAFSFRTLTPADLGLSPSDLVLNIATGVHPNGSLYILAEGSTSSPTTGVAVVSTTDGVSFTRVGSKYLPPAPYSGAGARTTQTSLLLPVGGDLYGFFWEKSAAGVFKLFTLSVSQWGVDRSPGVTVDTAAYPDFGNLAAIRGFTADPAVTMYVGARNATYALGLTCTAPDAPAAASLVVERDPCPGGAPACPLADGDTVFVGDRLRLHATVVPPAAVTPLTDWRFDYDFHDGSGADSNPAYPRVKTPDLSLQTSGASPPDPLALVGPCDPSALAGVVPSTGTLCWSSVLSNGARGGPDFSASDPPGTTRPLSLAFEARNANNPAGTASFVKRTLNWKLPAALLASTSVLLGASTLTSASEGTPLATGYKWYFATVPDGPAGETLVQDAACTGPTCNHAFPARGTYRYWLTVPYAGGYTTPECGAPCRSALGTITVTDVVLAFTVPTTVSRASTSIPIGNGSTIAPGVAPCGPTGYQFELCNAADAACTNPAAPRTFSNLPAFVGGSSSIPVPASAGTYWLRLRYQYTTSSCATNLLTANWTPATGLSDPTAWPIVVTDVLPTIWLKDANGADICPPGFSCATFDVLQNQQVRAFAYVNGAPDPNPPAGVSWSFGASAVPGTADGTPSPLFSYAAAGGKTITLSGYGAPVTAQVAVAPCGSCGPTPRKLYTVSPCRAVDTRNAAGPRGGPALLANATRTFPVAGFCGVPSTAKSVVANVTVVAPSSAGDLRIYPAGSAQPPTSAINFPAGAVRANLALVSLGGAGDLAVFAELPSGSVDFVLDVTGYFE